VNSLADHSISDPQFSEEVFSLLDPVLRFAEKMGVSPEEVLKQMMEAYLSKCDKNAILHHESSELSHRQRTVLAFLRRGMSVKKIAAEMQISEPTVRTHIQRIRDRLGCSDLLTLRMKES
jgi:DNA-binding NarL/FixJ family response regulator